MLSLLSAASGFFFACLTLQPEDGRDMAVSELHSITTRKIEFFIVTTMRMKWNVVYLGDLTN
jgi:hypothetical protein